jgi:omega-amidase
MTPLFNIATIQTHLTWENKATNMDMFDEHIYSIKNEKVDLIVLPEMFTTGFSMNPSTLAENSDDSPTLLWLHEKAKMTNAAICGSFIVREDEKYYNRLYFVTPQNDIYHYDKRHLFAFAGEDEHYTAGTAKIIVEWRGWRICPLICYDLRFPVWSRNVENYDLLLYVANWPERRINAWKTLLAARAIENQAYCVGVNRTGYDNNRIFHSGGSQIVDFSGEILYQKDFINDINITTLDYAAQANFRQQLPFLKDKDIFLTKF